MKLKPLTVIGLNSGTSMDSIDAAIFRIAPLQGAESIDRNETPLLSIELLAEILHEFTPSLRVKMKTTVACGNASLEEVCRLDAALGEEFAKAACSLMRSNPNLQVDLIGSHGQTIWHAPERKPYGDIVCANSMQLGDISIIAERTGVPVIGDFRKQDMAAGGQGAPLVAYADQVLFQSKGGGGIGVLNIGGIANLTALDEKGAAIMAFDTGPGNMLSDRCCEKLFGREFDEGGAIALSGEIDEGWLTELLKLPYFELEPPKTSGRELFGHSFADGLIEEGGKRKLLPQSILATITALTPASIAGQYERFIKSRQSIRKIVVGGGGAENRFMLGELRKRWSEKLEIARHEDYGISTRFKESLLFALLAYTTFFGVSNNVPACTGAERQVCLGKICRP